MTSLPYVILRPREADRILAGHPWIYKGAVQRLTRPAADGDLIAVKDHRQRFLGVGLYNSQSKIVVRMLSPERVTVDLPFITQRIQAALEVRKRHLPEATSFRVVNAESDQLSGLIVDKYEDVLVLQTSSLGLDRRKPMILETLQKLLAPRAIMERNDASFRKFEGLENFSGPLVGQVDGPVPVHLNGLTFEADIAAGHKTGLYLDQQVNYKRVAHLIALKPRARVLDAFTFQGGFALHAARAGADYVLGLDQSAETIATATRLAEANGLSASCRFATANVFDWLKSQTAKPGPGASMPQFDAVILDPPSFTRTRSAIPDAMRGYKEIHLRALRLLRPGGVLVTFCCSHHIDAVMFLDVILAAAFDARCLLRRVATYSQSPDHPILPSVPETEYLKGFAFEVVR